MTASSAESIGASGAAPDQLYVINLAASTSPMALSHPSSPELKRYTFFVSRQREDGRERFRLHMGYFATQEEAEALLPTVRDIYPAAWAGPAPSTGMNRRGRIAPGRVAAVRPAPVPMATPQVLPPAPPAAPVEASAQPPAAPVVAAIPSSAAADSGKAAPQAAAREAAVAQPAAVTPAAGGVRAPAPAAKVARPGPAVARAASAPAAPGAGRSGTLDAMSNVRDVLAQLSESLDTDETTVQARIPAGLADMPTTQPAGAPAPTRAAAGELTPAEALSLLESAPPQARSPAVAEPPPKNPFEGLENEPEVRLITPEDTQTLTDIRIDRQNNAPPCFAVQLVWSVTPIDVSSLPHLAIFDAYTLYNVEGNHQGRKWYGLRLGFFSDPNSATQVANYVRSDYRAVAVVPVPQKERDRAKGTSPSVAATAAGEPKKTTEKELVRDEMQGFELLADDRPPPPKRDLDDAAGRNGKATLAVRAPRAAAARAQDGAAAPRADAPPGTPRGRPVGKRVVARRRPPPVPQGRVVSTGVGGPEVLESTLEILGASTLSLDEGGREIVTDAAARKPEARKAARPSRFSRLLSRLAGG